METHEKHKQEAPKNLNVAIITVSTTRNEETDLSGKLLKDIIEENGHSVTDYAVVPDLQKKIAGKVKEFIDNGAEAIIVNGGTGIALDVSGWQGPYLRTADGNLPKDPFTDSSTTWSYTASTGHIQSGSTLTAIDGTAYSAW